MGGFEGGDEGGFWDVDSISILIDEQHKNKPKKKEIFHITTNDLGYSIKVHEKGLYDTISFVSCACKSFKIEGCDDVPIESNVLYKAYQALLECTCDSDISDFFYEHKVVVTKAISSSVDLSGESDTFAFMRLLKETCNLILSDEELVKTGRSFL